MPKERVASALAGTKPDKLPIMVANSNTFICRYYGISVEEFLSDASLCAEGNIRFTEEFGADFNICINGYILYGCGPELGCRWKFAGPDFPGFEQGPLKTPEDLDRIKIPEQPTGYFAHYLEVIRRVQAALGDRYHLSVSILGPFAVACFMRGIEQALLDTITGKEFLGRYMEKCTELSIWFGRHILATGLEHPFLNEIFLSPTMVSPATYEDLIKPYDARVQEALGPENAPNSLAAFMSRSDDPNKKSVGARMYKVFFSGADSMAELEEVLSLAMEGFPFPAAISGPSLDTKSGPELVGYLRSTLDFLVRKKGIYPSILLSSVQAHSPDKAKEIAEKIMMIKALRDEYQL